MITMVDCPECGARKTRNKICAVVKRYEEETIPARERAAVAEMFLQLIRKSQMGITLGGPEQVVTLEDIVAVRKQWGPT